MNLRKAEDRGRLFEAIERSYRAIEPFRNLVSGLVEEYAGSGYGAGGKARREILVNLMNQAVDAYVMALVANRPRVTVTPKRQSNWFFAKRFEVAMNNLTKEIGLERTLRKAVLDAFFCVGVVRVHMAESIEVRMEDGTYMDPGSPYVSSVPLENFVFDMSAPEYHKSRFMGNTYRVPFSYLKSDHFDQNVVKELTPTSRGPADEDRLEEISKGQATDKDEVVPMIDLADIWVRETKSIWTFAVDSVTQFKLHHAPLAVEEWTGSQHGPYPTLGFGDVPGNVMPISHASQLSGLSRLVNNIMRKQGRRARSQKKLHTYTPAGSGAAKASQMASDDQWVEVADPDQIGEINVGGVDANSQAFVIFLTETLDRMAGNLTAILGLGSQSETVGQEQMIHQASSRRIAKMQYEVADFSRIIIRDLGHLLWDDVVKQIPGEIVLEGLEEFPIVADWEPGVREGRFIDYELDVDVNSMPYQSPAERLKSINYILTQIYAPMLQQIEAQGGQIDFHKLNEMYADLMNEPRLRELVQFAGRHQGGEEEGGAPQSTSREYVRRSAGGNPHGQSQQMQQAWLAAAPERQSSANAPDIAQ